MDVDHLLQDATIFPADQVDGRRAAALADALAELAVDDGQSSAAGARLRTVRATTHWSSMRRRWLAAATSAALVAALAVAAVLVTTRRAEHSTPGTGKSSTVRGVRISGPAVRAVPGDLYGPPWRPVAYADQNRTFGTSHVQSIVAVSARTSLTFGREGSMTYSDGTNVITSRVVLRGTTLTSTPVRSTDRSYSEGSLSRDPTIQFLDSAEVSGYRDQTPVTVSTDQSRSVLVLSTSSWALFLTTGATPSRAVLQAIRPALGTGHDFVTTCGPFGYIDAPAGATIVGGCAGNLPASSSPNLGSARLTRRTTALITGLLTSAVISTNPGVVRVEGRLLVALNPGRATLQTSSVYCELTTDPRKPQSCGLVRVTVPAS